MIKEILQIILPVNHFAIILRVPAHKSGLAQKQIYITMILSIE